VRSIPNGACALRRRVGVVVLLSGLGACAQVEREPLPEKAVVEEVESRERLDRQAWEQALELRGPLSWRPIGESVGDPAREGYWCGRAMVLSAEVRQAVRAWRAAVAATGVAGSPGPIEVTGRGREGERSDVAGELRITVDLLGLLGLSPLAEEREMSEQRARHERGRTCSRAWWKRGGPGAGG